MFFFNVTDGCISNPEICDYVEEIEDLTAQIEELSEQYESDYAAALEDYINLRDCMYK